MSLLAVVDIVENSDFKTKEWRDTQPEVFIAQLNVVFASGGGDRLKITFEWLSKPYYWLSVLKNHSINFIKLRFALKAIQELLLAEINSL